MYIWVKSRPHTHTKCGLSNSNKTPNSMQQSVVKYYYFVVQTPLNMFRALLCPSSAARQTAVAASGFSYECESGCVLSRGRFVSALINRPRLRTHPLPHSYGNQKLQREFDGLQMMGIIMPETCWAVSVRQSNNILRLIVASSWVFYLSDRRCTEPQTPKFMWTDVSSSVPHFLQVGVLLNPH